MNTTRTRTMPRALRVALAALAVASLLGTVSAVAARNGGPTLADVREATARFHDVAVARAAGYGEFYFCTDNETPGVGAMGQHFANGPLVFGDPEIDALRPEVLMYAPTPDGGWRLIGMEYVVLQADWEAAHPGTTPTVLGMPLKAVGAGNRYGLDPFWQRHVWLWRNNPTGIFEDWNPKVSCRGTGDPA